MYWSVPSERRIFSLTLLTEPSTNAQFSTIFQTNKLELLSFKVPPTYDHDLQNQASYDHDKRSRSKVTVETNGQTEHTVLPSITIIIIIMSSLAKCKINSSQMR